MKLDKSVGGTLCEAFLRNKAAHAYIVVGEKGSLPELLRQCAAVCMCPSHSAEDACEVCKKVYNGVHQDVLRFPKDEQKGKLTVADVEILVEECYKRPIDTQSICRVFLLNAANSTVGAASEVWQNKLLKTLEEPNDGIYIFLGVSDVEGLLPTVRSRCQILRQKQLSIPQICGYLEKHYQKDVCEIASCVCGGNLQKAESILANPQIVQAFKIAGDMLSQMTSSKNALPFVSQIVARRDMVEWVLEFSTVLLRESLVYRLADQLCLLPSHTPLIEKICANYSLTAAEVCIEIVSQAKKHLDENGNVNIVIDNLASSLLEVKYRCRI